MGSLRKTVLWLTTAVFLVWVYCHFGMITGDENGRIRFVLSLVFALITLLRRKERDVVAWLPPWVMPATAVVGTLLALSGIIFSVGQFEWLGLILLLHACLCWSFSRKYHRDIALALFILYWIHPLPGQLFASFQLGMQVLSVKASEWLLHCFNVRVWADGLTLSTGFQTFLVPESCSGMVTAVTVLLTSLGVGILFRFKWYEVLVLMVLGAVQVLVLNILRIYFMVVWSARMPLEWAPTFLHDTLGYLLLAAILLVQVEAVVWKRWLGRRTRQEKGVESGEIEEPERATILPGFWRVLFRWAWVGLLIFIFTGGIAFAVYKRRPEHRAAMVSDVADGLMAHDLDGADRAVSQALRFKPGSRDLLSKRIQVLVLRGKYAEGLAVVEKFGNSLSTVETVMKSCCLMSLNRADEAIALVEALPESDRHLPGVAMIRAEYAAGKDRPAAVASNIVHAAMAPQMMNRARSLYPYLGIHKQWRAIVDSDNENIPYRDCAHALIVIYASLELNDIFHASRTMKAGLAAWPNDARFIGSLFMLASRRPGSEWEELFAGNIRQNVASLDADRLASYMEYCFKLSRPDLAWLLYLRLREVDPRDPALYLVPAQFGDLWFLFRRHQLGIEAANRNLRIDLKPFYLQTRNVEPFKAFWERVPLAGELSAGALEKKRAEYLGLCLAELESRRKSGRINRRMHMSYPNALIMAGRYKEAEAVLDGLETIYPDAARELLYERAVFYDQQRKWEHSYETLRKYRELSGSGANLNAAIMMVNAMINLNMGVCAMDAAQSALETFPESSQVLMTIAGIWNVFGFKDQALLLLSRMGEDQSNVRAIGQLLYETGCFREAEKLSMSTGFNITRNPAMEKQGLFPPPAEWTVMRRWPAPLTPVEMAGESERSGRESGASVSPFRKRLAGLSAEWYGARGQGEVSDINRWLAAGRDDVERAGALHQLALMLARQKLYEQAAKSAGAGLALMPRSAVMWRVLISLTEGDAAVVGRARAACPSDPDIWLAGLVIRVNREGGGKWVMDEVERAAASREFAPGTMVRAGDFLLRKNLQEPARIAAHNAIERCRGALPAYMLGLECALTAKDMKWAVTCALNGVDNARDPSPFYKLLVEIKSLARLNDADSLTALEYLKQHFPRERQWSERLIDAYFQKGDLKRAMSVFDDVLAGSLKGVKVRSLLLAAEAARLEGEYAKSIAILETAYSLYPDMPDILNNLVYNLVREGNNTKNLERARALLPKLIEIGKQSAFLMDTVAVVYMKSGNMTLAKQYSDKARELVHKNDYAALEIDFNAAEIMFRLGATRDARQMLEKIRHAPVRSQLVDYMTRDLLNRIEEETGKR